MRIKFTVGDRTYRLELFYKYIRIAPSPFIENAYAYCYKYHIKIVNLDTGKQKSFPFWGSVHDFKMGKREMNENDLLQAFLMILQDGVAVIEYPSLDEFMKGFGYTDPKEAERIYMKLQKVCHSLKELLNIDDDTFVDIVNYLIDLENEDRLSEIIER